MPRQCILIVSFLELSTIKMFMKNRSTYNRRYLRVQLFHGFIKIEPFNTLFPLSLILRPLQRVRFLILEHLWNKSFQHIVPPLSHAKAMTKDSNPKSRTYLNSSWVIIPSYQKVSHVGNTLSNKQNQQIYSGKGSVTECGSVAGGTVRTIIETDQGIPTSNRFSILLELSQEDNSTWMIRRPTQVFHTTTLIELLELLSMFIGSPKD